jgi:hypothetical protein
LTIGSFADSAGTIVPELRRQNTDRSTLHVVSVAFDQLQLDVTGMKLIKVDAEGAECEVLHGMTGFLASNRPLIVCEVLHADSSSKLHDLSVRNQAMLELLRALNYVIFRLIKAGDHVAELECVAGFPNVVWDPKTSPNLCDYLLVPNELIGAVRSVLLSRP